jgi:hypothetical protein
MDLAKSKAISPSLFGSTPLFPVGPGVKPLKSESIQFRSHSKEVGSKKSIVILDRESRRHSTKDDTRKSSKAQNSHFGRRRFTEMRPPGSQSAINFKSESVPLGGPLKVIREENKLSEEIAPKKFGHHKSTIFQGQHLVGSPGD